jgi:cell division protein FtsB
VASRPRSASADDGRFLRLPPHRWSPRRSLAYLGGVAVLLFFLSPLLGENGLPTYLRLRSRRAELQQRVEDMRVRDAALQQRTTALLDDPTALEELARERYNMRRPGETVYEIVDDEEEAERSP